MLRNNEKNTTVNLNHIKEILIKPKCLFGKEVVSKEKYDKFVENWEKRIFDGVPCFLRHQVYSILMNNYKLEMEYSFKNVVTSKYEHQIDVDIQRTFRDHPLFKEKYGPGQCRLFRLLTSFANSMPEIGYCQGMSSIAAVLLMYFDESDAFKMMVKMIVKNNLGGLFDKSLSKLDFILQVQDTLIEKHIPKIRAHLLKEKISYNVYATSWYLTLFTRFKLELCLRIWDLFFFYDFSILLYLVIAILKYFESEILNFTNENLIEFVSKIERYEINTEKLFKILKKLVKNADLNKVRLTLGIKPKS